MEYEITDKRGQTWEMFCDASYYDMWCVRWASNREFNTMTSFHFDKQEQAARFLKLLSVST